MNTRRKKLNKSSKKHNKNNSGKKWISAYNKATKTLKSTGSLKEAKAALKKQALINARKLFGSVGKL